MASTPKPGSDPAVTPGSDAGITIGPPLAATQAVTPPRTPASSRFAPGSIIAGRYRLVALLGKGGMGEVYRADDLTLDQPVALKFLPVHQTGGGDATEHDEVARLAQFHNELRFARQVSHKNVCRLYDLGEAGGRRFLTMEYVDGEDLASLVRRIGRLAPDKAIEIARQLCAGLAAAHERGVLHRDLKPANVMLDGEGNVRITDFGLAVASSEAAVGRAGTPQYMAPEQLAGQPATIKSDIYALGLVLFEIFTGRRAYDARTLADLIQAQASGAVTTPSSLVRDLDPAVERIILRCLERDPGRRPGSALAVAAALPGGNPLAEALAAGETPSPELLVAAGETDAVAVVPALAATVIFIGAMIAFAALAPQASITGLVPLDKPVDVLTERAQQMIAASGYSEPAADRARGFSIPPDSLRWAQAQGPANWWPGLRSGAPPAMLFWYRTSPRELVPDRPGGSITATDPPQIVPGMTLVILDTLGRLAEFHHVPPELDPNASPAAATDWPTLFDAAGLSLAKFTAATPQWTPKEFADARAAWEGPLAERVDLRVRVEAASYGGRPVSFSIVGPWSRASQMQPLARTTLETILSAVNVGIWLVAFFGGALLARYNLRTNRADRRAAARLAIGLVMAELVVWLLSAHHVTKAEVELSQMMLPALAIAILLGTIAWVLYLAIEPYARRFWPDGLLGWTRLLAGRVRDPRVGRDVLVGLLIGAGIMACETARGLLPQRSGYTAMRPPFGGSVASLASTPMLFTRWVDVFNTTLQSALFVAMVFVVLRLVVRRAWLAAVIGVVVITTISDNGEALAGTWIDAVVITSIVSLATYAVFRHGLLVLVVALFADNVLTNIPLTLHASAWWATPSNLTLVLFVAIACFGFYAARAGQPLFGTFDP